MGNLEIRLANIDELPNILSLTEQAYSVSHFPGGPISKPHFSETLEEDILGGKMFLFVAMLGDAMVGTVRYEIKDDGTLYLSQMGVLPEYRKRGIGSSLIQAAEDHAKENGHTEMCLGCMREKNLPPYYSAMGYKEYETIQRPTYELVRMKKVL